MGELKILLKKNVPRKKDPFFVGMRGKIFFPLSNKNENFRAAHITDFVYKQKKARGCSLFSHTLIKIKN